MIQQPQSTDKLNLPSHSLSHRVFANDDAAPAQIIVVDSAGKVGIGTPTPAYKLDVNGSIQTNATFRGDTWVSATGNSMNIQPSGDTDDYFSFKTPAHRPTIKREGGKYIYVESSNVNDVGISFRKDADHSGTINYYKDENLFGLTSKDPLVFKVCADYVNYVKICAADSIPEISVVNSSGFKINAGGTNALLLNHAGGNVGIGTDSPDTKLEVNGAITQSELSADPSDPAEGKNVIWQSDGTGSGDDGDIMMKITAGAVTKITTLINFSEI